MIRMLKTAGLCLLLLLAMAPTNFLAAQGREITGTVTSSDTKLGLQGVTVTVKGTKISTTTDAQGNYKLKVDGKATALLFTSASYTAYEAG